MNLRHLSTFVIVADHGGFARAATKLNLTQSAASRQIQALEAELGVPLFDRVGRRVQLTSEGEDLLRRGRHLLTEAESLGDRARALRTGETGILRVGATTQMIENLLASFLKQHRARHAGVEVHLVEEGGARMPARLDRGDVQLAIMPAGDERFRGRLLGPMHVLAALPRAHRLARRAVIEIKDLADEPLLLLHHEFGSRAWFDAAGSVAQMRPRIFLESAAPHTLIALAAANYGIAIVPSTVRILGRVRVVPLVHRGASIGRWAVVSWDQRRFLPVHGEQFVEELVAYSQRAFPGLDVARRAPALPRPKSS